MSEWIQSVWHKFVYLCSAQPLTVILFGGLVGLTITLLIVMRTRVGQARPLWTCAVLSVLAHILLIGYAYGTRLSLAVSAPQQDIVKFRLLENPEQEEVEEIEQGSSSEVKPWMVSSAPEASARVESELQPNSAEPSSLEFDMDSLAQNVPTEKQEIQSDVEVEFKTRETDSPELPELSPEEPIAESAVEAAPLQIERPQPIEQPVEENLAHEAVAEAEASPLPDLVPATAEPQPIDDFTMVQPERTVEPPPIDLDSLVDNAPEFVVPAIARQPETEDLQPAEALQPESWRPQPHPSTIPNVRPAATTRRSGDGKPMPAIYGARAAKEDVHWLAEAGGNLETEAAVESALRFLSHAQEADGRWDASRFGGGLERHTLGHDRQGAGRQADTAVTALSLLAFLAAGNTHLDGEHRLNVQRALEYLLRVQRADGNLAGDALMFSQMYCHSMATLALCEAYAMTGDVRLRDAAQLAINFSVNSQNYQDGGWRYRPGDSGDMSQFGWHVMAMKSARLGGLDVPQVTWERMKKFLRSCTSGTHQGLASYRPGQPPTAAMTAEALVCRYFLETNPSHQAIAEASGAIVAHRPNGQNINYYYWYYATLAMKQTGGEAWRLWNADMQHEILQLQRQDGELQGSYDPNGLWSGYGGRIYSTAMATLCLESYYRYLPAMKTPDNR